MARIAIFIHGVLCYLVFFGTFLYAIGFVSNILMPRTIDSAPRMGLTGALAINLLLLGIFAIQHSVMARPAFKQRWTRLIPAPAERSTYVLFSSLALIALFFFWQPMGGIVWDIQHPVGRIIMMTLAAAGWALVLVSTFLINHFDLFGLRQVWLHLRGEPYTHLPFKTPVFYKHVRHPLYVGWFLAFWATPTMTAAHLVFAVMTAAYILIAIQLEERDLMDIHGEDYRQYRRRVPMLIPRLRSARRATASNA